MGPPLSTRDTADRMSLSVRRVRQLIAKRQLRHVSISGRSLVPESAIAEFFQAYTVEALPPDTGPGKQGADNAQ